jgi:hypothetical protein
MAVLNGSSRCQYLARRERKVATPNPVVAIISAEPENWFDIGWFGVMRWIQPHFETIDENKIRQNEMTKSVMTHFLGAIFASEQENQV